MNFCSKYTFTGISEPTSSMFSMFLDVCKNLIDYIIRKQTNVFPLGDTDINIGGIIVNRNL